MFERNQLVSKFVRDLTAATRAPRSQEPIQRQAMVIALSLLLAALGLLLYHDRDFWFPDQPQALAQSDDERQPQAHAPSVVIPPAQPASNSISAAHKKSHAPAPVERAQVLAEPVTDSASTPPTTITRTVLPPLQVEVVAGNVHHQLQPGASTVHVELQPDTPSPQVAAPAIADNASDTASAVTTNASERVEMSPDTTSALTEPVKPGYPLLARQMKVQGSVILQALIGRDGLIQDLHVVSGPPILASAAEQAVRQWHFKPHYLGSEAVETQARITVNFTISTN